MTGFLMSEKLPNLLRWGFEDITHSVRTRDLWLYLGRQDIKMKYRRSVLGPWWYTLSTGILVLTLGLLWSQVFNQPTGYYMSYFAAGIVTWTFISGFITESATSITQFEGFIKQQHTHFFQFVLRIYIRHLLILAHNFLVVAIVFLFAGPGFTFEALAAIPGLVILSLLMLMIGAPVAIFCTRFRDMPQIINNLLQVIFYLTPIIWEAKQIGRFQFVSDWNPFHAMVSIIRKPLLGELPAAWDFLMIFILIAICTLATAGLLGKYRRRIAYWL